MAFTLEDEVDKPNGNVSAFAPKEQKAVETANPEEEKLLYAIHADVYSRAITALEENIAGTHNAVVDLMASLIEEVATDQYVAGAVKNVFSSNGKYYLELASFLLSNAVKKPEAVANYMAMLKGIVEDEAFVDIDELWKENKKEIPKEYTMKTENQVNETTTETATETFDNATMKARFEKAADDIKAAFDTAIGTLTNKEEEETSMWENPWVIAATVLGVGAVGIGAYMLCCNDSSDDIVILD